jgi:phosphate transport system permease protein
VAVEKTAAALAVHDEIEHLQKKEIGAINYALERLRLKRKKLQLQHQWNEAVEQQLVQEEADFHQQYEQLQTQLVKLNEHLI